MKKRIGYNFLEVHKHSPGFIDDHHVIIDKLDYELLIAVINTDEIFKAKLEKVAENPKCELRDIKLNQIFDESTPRIFTK